MEQTHSYPNPNRNKLNNRFWHQISCKSARPMHKPSVPNAHWQAGSGFTGLNLDFRSELTPTTTDISLITVPVFRIHAHPHRTSRHEPQTVKRRCTNHAFVTGSRFTGQYFNLWSKPTSTPTCSSWVTVPDFRFHAHQRWASQHDHGINA